MFNSFNFTPDQKKLISDQVSGIYDPVSLSIPEDPIFVHYENIKNVRLFSKQTLLGLHEQLKICRSLFKEGQQDKTFIKLALVQYAPCSEKEEIYQLILLEMVKKGYTCAQLLKACEQLDSFLFILANLPSYFNTSLTQPTIPKEFNFILNLLVQFHEIVSNQQKQMTNAALRQHVSISAFLEKLIFLQTAIVEENRRKLYAPTGELLRSNQVVCPYTRCVINVDKSLKNSYKAKLFLNLVIALAKLADIHDLEIDNFLQEQSSSFLEQAYEDLNNSVDKLPGLFTAQQQKFLTDMGLLELMKQTRLIALKKRYQHLWDEKYSPQENTLTVLNDYSKVDYASPHFRLFITGHWGRNHHVIVKKAIQQIKGDTVLKLVLADLAEQARANPHFNADGSLARRLEFIHLQLGEQLELNEQNSFQP